MQPSLFSVPVLLSAFVDHGAKDDTAQGISALLHSSSAGNQTFPCCHLTLGELKTAPKSRGAISTVPSLQHIPQSFPGYADDKFSVHEFWQLVNFPLTNSSKGRNTVTSWLLSGKKADENFTGGKEGISFACSDPLAKHQTCTMQCRSESFSELRWQNPVKEKALSI